MQSLINCINIFGNYLFFRHYCKSVHHEETCSPNYFKNIWALGENGVGFVFITHALTIAVESPCELGIICVPVQENNKKHPKITKFTRDRLFTNISTNDVCVIIHYSKFIGLIITVSDSFKYLQMYNYHTT